VYHGAIVLLNYGSNIWVESGNIGLSTTTQVGVSGGSKSLAGVLERVRLTTAGGTDTFDLGGINLIYE
jgi:hypothetical protein